MTRTSLLIAATVAAVLAALAPVAASARSGGHGMSHGGNPGINRPAIDVRQRVTPSQTVNHAIWNYMRCKKRPAPPGFGGC